MNIREAGEEIRKSVEIYLDKNEYGEYMVPVSQQRPIYMTGAPGIGKTAVVRQIAAELDLALVFCPIAQQTRQSVSGRPVTVTREYGGHAFTVSEYTMSELIAAMYQAMEKSGRREGILLLDEVNRVPETLAPALRLLLQHRVLGNRRVPRGWIVIAAGDSYGYGRGARPFDMALLDRLRCLNIKADFSVWRQYVCGRGIHGAVLAFLELHRQWFYFVQGSAEGMRYATARGWEELSAELQRCEKKGFPVRRNLIDQYIVNPNITKEFMEFYDLYCGYRERVRIADILAGEENAGQSVRDTDRKESIAVTAMLLESLNREIRRVVRDFRVFCRIEAALGAAEEAAEGDECLLPVLWQCEADRLTRQMEQRRAAGNLTGRERDEYRAAIRILQRYAAAENAAGEKGAGENAAGENAAGAKTAGEIREMFQAASERHRKEAEAAEEAIQNAVRFVEAVWAAGPEPELLKAGLAVGTAVLREADAQKRRLSEESARREAGSRRSRRPGRESEKND